VKTIVPGEKGYGNPYRFSLWIPMPSYRDLKAWQHAMKLAVACAKAAKQFPKEEQLALAEQLRRAAHSIPLNIAEGTARKGSREFRRFLDTAWGSLSEVQSALEVARELGYCSEEDYRRIDAIATETGKTLWGLLRKINRAASPSTSPN
jgi:four helix bundle protein